MTGGGAGEMQPAHRARGEGASAQAQTFRVQDTEENQEEGRLSQVLICKWRGGYDPGFSANDRYKL